MERRRIKWIVFVIPAGWMMVLTACIDTEDLGNKGSEAAVEFCECYEKSTKETCFENLKSRYESYQYMSNEFIETFNETNTCGATLIKEQITSASFETEDKRIIYP
jgi:hypothetical protein